MAATPTNTLTTPDDLADLDALHARMRALPPADRVRWAVDTYGDGLVLTTSFGVQAAVMLHLVTRVAPGHPRRLRRHRLPLRRNLRLCR